MILLKQSISFIKAVYYICNVQSTVQVINIDCLLTKADELRNIDKSYCDRHFRIDIALKLCISIEITKEEVLNVTSGVRSVVKENLS